MKEVRGNKNKQEEEERETKKIYLTKTKMTEEKNG